MGRPAWGSTAQASTWVKIGVNTPGTSPPAAALDDDDDDDDDDESLGR